MPTYVYLLCDCPSPEREEFDRLYPDAQKFTTTELNLPIEKRDTVKCGNCGEYLKRKPAFTGATIIK